ncbi:hypothetical protein EVG20_g3283 [Dentipellis fragilis]|uniref:Protein kinase domain-containing protein n=1 Tax=Dentipellis fragilis TaxID=205917 RepID=A0A4Y9Z5Q6_9AGAM|nr:hypothetical protein EVG20_g3283 [Dentipellis fragilis]
MATSTPCSTPIRNRSKATEPLTDANPPKSEQRYLQLSKDMENQFVGPMPVREFLKAFVPDAPTPCPSGDVFRALRPSTAPEAEDAQVRKFEDRFIDAVKAAHICPDLELFNTTTRSGNQYVYKQKPDISVRRKMPFEDQLPTSATSDALSSSDAVSSSDTIPPTTSESPSVVPQTEGEPSSESSPVHWTRMELCIECKTHPQDPFADPSPTREIPDRDDYVFEKTSKEATKARGQLISYAAAHMSTQFRCFCFSICIINETDARLMRWDRSGVIVTERFNFTQEDSPLADFLWRFNHLNGVQRGFDLSVTPASDEETRLARDDFDMKDGNIHKVLVRNDADGVNHYFLIAAPAEYRLVVTGRASFGYVALDLQEKKKVWLKDSWRIDLTEMEKEYQIYAKLRHYHVRNIAPLVCGGDVGVQRTLTQDFADKPWRYGKVVLLPHRHYRIVLGIVGRPLKGFRSTKEMVDAVFDALTAHWDAYTLAKILHRDISGGNIVILDEGERTRGILIDWDLSKGRMAEARARRKWRTGTWQFISAALLANTHKLHEYCDDLESFAHVITYFILRYRPWTLRTFRDDMYELFDKAQEDESGEIVGGKGKLHFFGNTLFNSEALENTMPSHLAGLINDLRDAFTDLYAALRRGENIEDKKMKAKAQLKSPDLFLSIRQRYSDDAWATDDASEDQLKSAPSESQLAGTKRKASSSLAFSSSSGVKPKKLYQGQPGGTLSTLAYIAENDTTFL